MQFTISTGGQPEFVKSQIRSQADASKKGADPASAKVIDAFADSLIEYADAQPADSSMSISVSVYVSGSKAG